MARLRISYLMQSKVIFDRDAEGKRFTGGTVRWGRWENWRNYADNTVNLREAVEFVNRRLMNQHIGSNIYVRVLVNRRPTSKFTRLYQAKWGHDDAPFVQFDGIAGYWWKGRIGAD